jgi:NAD(P)H dehydrogenase (quinone)
MMKAHIVFAHPNLHSYNGQLRNTAIETLEAQGCQVSVSDLYQMKFKAAADEDDFTALYNTDFLICKQNSKSPRNEKHIRQTFKGNTNF